MSYKVFIRNWWKVGASGQLEPDTRARRYTLYDNISTADEASAICKEYNATHRPGKLSRKAEYTSY